MSNNIKSLNPTQIKPNTKKQKEGSLKILTVNTQEKANFLHFIGFLLLKFTCSSHNDIISLSKLARGFRDDCQFWYDV